MCNMFLFMAHVLNPGTIVSCVVYYKDPEPRLYRNCKCVIYRFFLSPSFESFNVRLFRSDSRSASLRVPAVRGVRCSALLPVSLRTFGNMASDGMILTNHDHQIRVGILTGRREMALNPSRALDTLVSVQLYTGLCFNCSNVSWLHFCSFRLSVACLDLCAIFWLSLLFSC